MTLVKHVMLFLNYGRFTFLFLLLLIMPDNYSFDVTAVFAIPFFTLAYWLIHFIHYLLLHQNKYYTVIGILGLILAAIIRSKAGAHIVICIGKTIINLKSYCYYYYIIRNMAYQWRKVPKCHRYFLHQYLSSIINTP